MKIMEKINDLRKEIEAGNGDTIKRIGEQSAAAVDGGRGSQEWEQYMRNFASNQIQLDRLIGEHTEFNEQPNPYNDNKPGFGKVILAYIVGAGICMSGTGLREAAHMPEPMATRLDDKLPEEEDGILEKQEKTLDLTDEPPRNFVSA